MNSVFLIGRLTRDPEVRYTAESQMAIARFNLAIDRITRSGEEKKADFPTVVAFGKQAEVCERFLTKGRQVAIEGRLQTGSYQNKDGVTVYTTEVIANRVELIGNRGDGGNQGGYGASDGVPSAFEKMDEPSVPEGFASVDDDDLPF